jgi:DNA (cytosine-5)-methyltransferase 3A
MIKLLLGGSPCTQWSIAQKNNRETEPKGLGWELFRNYLIAKDKFRPDFFLYENNKSAAQPIKDQISTELDVDLMYINSALVSAQNRQRFYAFNWDVEQPGDRGIVLRDVLESSVDEKAYALAEPIRIPDYGLKDKARPLNSYYSNNCGGFEHRMFNKNPSKQQVDMIAEPIRIGTIENNLKNKNHDSKQYRVYSLDGKSTTLCGQGGGVGAKTGLYACPATGFEKNVYLVENGFITVKDKQYPINLDDGLYIIRKLTVKECCRLQTLPDDYCRAVSNTQAYKGLGNGWTAEVIIHILNGALKDVPRDEEIVVLSMYDGIGTGRYCLDKMGFTNVKYFAYEIDKYAKQVSMSNYPDIIQCGDAFDLRHLDWTIGY